MPGEGGPETGRAQRDRPGPAGVVSGPDGRPRYIPPTPAPWQGLPGPASLDIPLPEQLAGYPVYPLPPTHPVPYPTRIPTLPYPPFATGLHASRTTGTCTYDRF